MLDNLEASLVQLDYIAADLAQNHTNEGDADTQVLQALRRKMRAARCAVEIAIELFGDFERTQGERRVIAGTWPGRRTWAETYR